MTSEISPQDFIFKWQQSSLKERSSYQEHFIDLCRLIGHQTPAELDPEGKFFTFEAGASKLTGTSGWADVWYKGHFAWEYKGKHANLDIAYNQLLQYRESLQNPPLLIVSDIDQIIIHTNFTNTVKRIYPLTLDDLIKSENLSILRSVFYKPNDLRAPQTTELVTQKAASQFALIAEILRSYGEDPSHIAHFLIRLLFCLFAEDVSLLPEDLFTRLVEHSRTKPKAFSEQLRQLFAAMSTGGWFGPEEILHFDGQLFDDESLIELDSESLDILSQVVNLDWSSIEPSIFGTLFERSLDPSKRSQLGAHYTSKEDILLIIEPVLMSPLRNRWQKIKAQALDLVSKRDSSKGSQRTKFQNKLTSMLVDFTNELSQIRVLDPACGSGNFLYVALRQLLDLEKEVINFAGEIGVGRFFPSIAPSQIFGIEINEYAYQLAQATIWIGYIQWLNENGFGFPNEPILKPLDNIHLIDAILAYDDTGKPIDPIWPSSDVIIGNPPFLGQKKMRIELGDRVVDSLIELYSDRLPSCDLVCYWFEKARNEISLGKVKRVGLLATQGIRSGSNRKVLDRIKNTGDIFFAYSDREWVLDGAMVHVSMVGFDDGTLTNKKLDGKSVETINSDLTSSINLTIAKKLKDNKNLSFMGDTKVGKFEIEYALAKKFLSLSGNPNGRSNQDVIKPSFNALDITRRNRNIWVIDFGINMSEEDASQYEAPFEYIKKVVKPYRTKARSGDRTGVSWWLHQRPRPEMRKALSSLNRYVATPAVSKHRIFSWVESHVLPDHALIVFAFEDYYYFGVLHSYVHELWSRAKGSQLREAESGFRYTPTTCFETFPFPWSIGKEPKTDSLYKAISISARELVYKRNSWLNPSNVSEVALKKLTLTHLYNQRPTWLDLAHRKLDLSVLDAYGWPQDISDEEILEKLLNLNFEYAANQ